jgi:hypothetical protein
MQINADTEHNNPIRTARATWSARDVSGLLRCNALLL